MDNVITALTAEQVENLTGLSSAQLRDWDREGFFAPTYAADNRRSPYSRIYSFEDLVGLRTLSILRKQERVPMSHLREVAKALAEHSHRPWSDLVLYVLNREVHFQNPATGKIEGATSGQHAIPIKLSSIMDDMRERAERLKQRDASTVGQVARHRYIAHNARVIAGTRIPIESVRSLSAAGYTVEQIMDEYPSLQARDVQAALDADPDKAAA
jgi:uncharacterized protein (DUF433 family)